MPDLAGGMKKLWLPISMPFIAGKAAVYESSCIISLKKSRKVHKVLLKLH